MLSRVLPRSIECFSLDASTAKGNERERERVKESVMKFWSIIIIVVVVDRQPTARWRVYNLESWLSICAERKSCSSLHLHHALIRLEIDFVYILKGFNGNLCLTKFKKFCSKLPGIGSIERPSARIKKKRLRLL